MARVSGYLSGLVPELQRGTQRFPWAVVAAALFAGYFLFGLHRTEGWYDPDNFGRVPLALSAAFLWALAATLFVESRGGDAGPLRHGLPLAGFLIIALLAAANRALELHPGFLLTALALGVGVAAYLRRGASQRAFWRFNHDLWVGYVVAAIAAALFGGGLSAIVETLRYLFQIDITYTVHEKIWAVSCGLVGPLTWLSVVPERLDEEIVEGPQTEFVSRMVSLLGKFLLVPLLLVYAVILHAYAIKIGLEWSLPKGRLGWMVLSFGTLVAATALLIFPTRASSGELTAWFWRFWPYVLIVPLALLFLAIGRRIGDYGITQERYIVVLAGLWLTLVALVHGFGIGGRDLRMIPGSLALFLAAAALGPWGVNAWPNRNQAANFHSILARHDLVRDGRAAPAADIVAKLSMAEQVRLSSIVDYLNANRGLDRLRPLLSGTGVDPFASQSTDAPMHARVAYDWQLGQRIKDRLGVAKGSLAAERFVNFYANMPGGHVLDGGRMLIGPVVLKSSVSREANPSVQIVTVDGRRLAIATERLKITIEDPGSSRRAVFDLAALVTGRGPFASAGTTRNDPVLLKSSDGTMTATLIIQAAGLTRAGSEGVALNHATVWVYVEP